MTEPTLGGTMKGRVLISSEALAAYIRSPEGPLFRELLKAADVVKDGAKRRVGVDTGTLRDSIVKRMVQHAKGPAAIVGSEVEYAWWHHEGTEPHEIRAAPGSVLSFVWHGDRVYFSKVNHPGSKPNRYLSDALDDLRGLY